MTVVTPPLQGVELSGLSAAISHFLNCFLSSYPNPVAHLPADELISKKRNRRRRNRPPGAADNTAWAVMTPQELWKNICQEAKNYFDFSLEWYVSRCGTTGLRRRNGRRERGSCGRPLAWGTGRGGPVLRGSGGGGQTGAGLLGPTLRSSPVRQWTRLWRPMGCRRSRCCGRSP